MAALQACGKCTCSSRRWRDCAFSIGLTPCPEPLATIFEIGSSIKKSRLSVQAAVADQRKKLTFYKLSPLPVNRLNKIKFDIVSF
jgi:hypothetical protein